MITDRGAAFTSNLFKEYCEERNINHSLVTTGVARGNGQVERVNRTIVETLTKMSVDAPDKWFKHVPNLQKILNSTVNRSTNKTPFELMFGVSMKYSGNIELKQLLEELMIEEFEDGRKDIRNQAKEQIAKVQEENRKGYDRRRKAAIQYNLGDLVAIKKTQFAPGTKMYPSYLGPYEIVKVKRNDRYDVRKVGAHEGPNSTSSAADFMKRWRDENDSESDEEDLDDGNEVEV